MILSLYNEYKSIKKVSKELGLSEDVVAREIAKSGYCGFVKVPQEEIPNIVTEYISGKSIKEIHSQTGYGLKQINYILIAYGVLRVRTPKIKKDESVFEVIDTQEKAYWLGFLYADGYVNESNSNIELTIKQKEHLEAFKKFLKTDSKVNKRQIIFNGKEYFAYRMNICSKKLVKDLVKLGCYQKKSLTLEFPTCEQVPSHLVRHFLRGYFDGDGSVSYYQKGNRHYCSMWFMGTENFLNTLQDLMYDKFSFNKRKLYYDNRSNAIGYNITGKKRLKMIYHFLYNDATVFLNYKKEKFDLIFV